MVAAPPPTSKRRQEQASCCCCRRYRRRRTRSVNCRAHRSTREPVSPTDPEGPSGAKEPAARRDRETAMDDEEGRARYWIWPLRIHAVVSCKNRSSHRRRDYLTSKGSHQNSRHRRRQHRNPPGGEGAAVEATPSPPQHGRHQLCLQLQNLGYYTKN